MPLSAPTVHPRLLDLAARFYPQTITVQRVSTVRDDYGQEVETWTDLVGHIDLEARVVTNGPGTGAGGWSGEIYANTGVYDIEGLTISLRGFYPAIDTVDRVVYNGNIYPIQAVEVDAEGVTTRLRTRKVS